MLLRSLLISALFCQLVAGGPILSEWLHRFVTEPSLRERVDLLLRAGKPADAARELDEYFARQRAAGRAAPFHAQQTVDFLRMNASGFVMGPALPDLSKLTVEELGVLVPIESASPRIRWVGLVQRHVKTFNVAEARGFRDPERYLLDLAVSQFPLPAWQQAPIESRVFIIASGLDELLVNRHMDALRAQGKIPFWYKSCEPLCENEAVGAFMATAGQTLIFDTPNSYASEMVMTELATAQRLQNGEYTMFLISQEAIKQAQQAGQDAAIRVVAVSAQDANQQ
jgi:hypothetical protein